MGQIVKQCAEEFPMLDMEPVMQPITRTVLRIRLHITPKFRYISTFVFSNSRLCSGAIAQTARLHFLTADTKL